MEYGVLTANDNHEEGDVVNINGRRYKSQREKHNHLGGIMAPRKECWYSLFGLGSGDKGCK